MITAGVAPTGLRFRTAAENNCKRAFEAPAAVSVMNRSGEGLRRNAQENRSMRKQAQRSGDAGGAGSTGEKTS